MRLRGADARNASRRSSALSVGHESVGVLLRDVDGRVLNVIHPSIYRCPTGERPSARWTDWTIDKARPHRGLRSASRRRPSKDQSIGRWSPRSVAPRPLLASVRNATWGGRRVAARRPRYWAGLRRTGASPAPGHRNRRLSARQLAERLSIDDAPLEARPRRGVQRHARSARGRVPAPRRLFGRHRAERARRSDLESGIYTQTQVALSRPRTIDEYQDILASNLDIRAHRAHGQRHAALAKAGEYTGAYASERDLALEAM